MYVEQGKFEAILNMLWLVSIYSTLSVIVVCLLSLSLYGCSIYGTLLYMCAG